MKLSTRGRQRLQWGFAGLICGCAVVYAYFHLVISPLMKDRSENRDRLATLTEKTDQAERELNGVATARREYSGLHAELEIATNCFVLRPVLGSTIVPAQNLLDPLAQECGVQMDSCVDRGRMEIPLAKKGGGLVFERYAMDVLFIGSYRTVCDFVSAVERANAYACVTDIDIQARAEDPSRHRVSVRIEWPVFGEEPVAAKPAKGAGASKAPAFKTPASKAPGASKAPASQAEDNQ